MHVPAPELLSSDAPEWDLADLYAGPSDPAIERDLDAALDEINTLMEVQGALQDASRGYLFVPWSGNLSEPWGE